MQSNQNIIKQQRTKQEQSESEYYANMRDERKQKAKRERESARKAKRELMY